MAQLVEFTPAKINLALHVVGQRDDGYHLLDSLVTFCEIGDQLKLQLDHGAVSDSLHYCGDFAGDLPATQDNIIWNTVAMLREAARVFRNDCPPVSIELTKSLPVASGMGGGSANAAAVLRGMKKLWQLPESSDLNKVALALGADVPMCLASKPLRATGIGDRLQFFDTSHRLVLLLVNPAVSVPTPQVFKCLTSKNNDPLPADLSENWANMLPALRNDLQEPATELFPVIGEALETISTQPGCTLSRMTGSGATCFGVFDSLDSAITAKNKIRVAHPDWWCNATQTVT